MSASAGSSVISARPLSTLSALAPAVQHPQQRRPAARRTRRPAPCARRAEQRVVRLAATAPAARASTRPCTHGGAAVLEQLRDGGVRRPGQAEPLGGGQPVEQLARPSGGEARAAAAGARRAGAGPPASSVEPKTPSPTVAPSSTSAGNTVTWCPARVSVADSSRSPNTQRRLAGPGQAGVGGDLGHGLLELRPQRLLQRLEVLAARLLGAAVVDDAVRRPQVLGHLRPVPGLARHDDAGRRRAASAPARRAAAPRPAGTAARNSRALLGAGTKLTRRFLGRLRIRLVTSSSRRPGTFQEKSSASTRFRVATGTSMVRPSSAAPGSKW